jgi:hypothetical protein
MLWRPSAKGRSCFPTAWPVAYAHQLRWRVEREGQPWNVLDGGHGEPVPAKLAQTAKELVKVGKRPAPVGTQFDVYVQAILIFLGKARIYPKAMNLPLPKDWKDWIG